MTNQPPTKASTLRLDLPMLLPDVPDARDSCVDRLMQSLESRPGVERVHIRGVDQGQKAELCVHFDPGILPLARVRRLAEQLGAELTDRFGHVVWQLEGIISQRRAQTMAHKIEKLPGVLVAMANVGGPFRIEFDRSVIHEDAIEQALENMGVRLKRPLQKSSGAKGAESKGAEPRSAVSKKALSKDALSKDGGQPPHEHDEHPAHGGIFGAKTEMIFAALCGALLVLGWLLPRVVQLPSWALLAIHLPAFFFGGYFALREAISSLRAGRFEIDFLMIVAAAGAAALGSWSEGELLLFLFSIGHALEGYAMGRAKRAIEALGDLAPATATVRRGGETAEVPVESLRVGDIVVVKPDERIAADGFVIAGESSVNQAPITGESVPIDKSPVEDVAGAAKNPDNVDSSSRVFAGTINGSGALEIGVTRASQDSTLARVIELINEAETNQSTTQRFTDRFERIFVPATLALVSLLLFAGWIIDEPFSATFYRAMAVLVAASPCALAIATPSAVLSGIARAARGGVLVKGGAPLENLGRLRAIAFDKTGTLTEGKPRLTDVLAAEGASEEELLKVAVGIEELSDHPLARAVVADGSERLVGVTRSTASGLRSITGRGLAAEVDGEMTYIGKKALFFEVGGPPIPSELRAAVEALEANGRTTMIVRKGTRYLGALGLMDRPRAPAASVIKELRRLGIRRMIMISGDNQHVANAIAKEIGLDEARGDLMPEDKVETIKSLRAEAKVAMVGDGVNDAPAMAHATVGIAMGAAGSDVALETADLALMADDLNHLPFAVGLSRATSRIIRQNLWFSLGMVAFLVPATMFDFVNIGPAVVFHEGSTVAVVFNALRLLGYKRRQEG